MTSNNFALYGTKILAELVRDIVFFPFWWYTKGLLRTIKGIAHWLASREKSLGLSVWIKNIHKPMYGQTDWQGKLISFFIRLVEILARSVVMLIWTMTAFLMLGFWLALPVYTIYQIVFQLIPL